MGARHPRRQATEEEEAGDTVSPGTRLGPKSAEAKTGRDEPTGPRDKCGR